MKIMTDVKEKMMKHQRIACAFLRIPDPSIAEVMAGEGVDLLVSDQEQYEINEETMLHIIRAAGCYGCPCLIRVSQIDREKIGRLMDGGAGGILLADTVDSSQVRELVKAVKYPPVGERGVSTESRNNHYGLSGTGVSEFPRAQNRSTIIGAIIETATAIADLDEILKIPELDFLSVGTMDLTYACGVPGDIHNIDVQRLKMNIYQKIIGAGKTALDKTFTEEEIERGKENGIGCFYVASDMELIKKGLEQRIKYL